MRESGNASSGGVSPHVFLPQFQSEGREKLKELEEFCAKQSEELESERRENERLKRERTDMLVRICKMLGYSEPKTTENGESELSELERHFQAVGLTVIKQQEELSKLRHFTSIMQRVSTRLIVLR